MFDATRIDAGDVKLASARAETDGALLAGAVTVEPRTPDAPLAALALVHGLVALHEAGVLERRHPGEDAAVLVRSIAQILFSDPANRQA
ncbi:hypothetical protein [Curtobacterium sp. VKM Ac-1376]|uniref:hypothetical protein n=1 Tax=Curtobacterium sp. VKM Ac-1376 TaxID=123312 RepID=UPI001E48E9D6|nr:hypothetical protein [Curtobacterium sp. VKM Ac-1376]